MKPQTLPVNPKYSKYFLPDQKCSKGTSCSMRSTRRHFLLDRKVPEGTSCWTKKYWKALPVWSATDCLSHTCPKVSHSRPNNGLDRYAAQADTAGHPTVQTTTNNTQIMVLHRQHATNQNQQFYNTTQQCQLKYNTINKAQLQALSTVKLKFHI